MQTRPATGDGADASSIYPPELAQQERALIAARRAALDLPHVGGTAPAVGLALSGGGIRSATFSLGLLQALARHRLIRNIDYLSTVSGGGYIGSFFGKLFQTSGGTPAYNCKNVTETLAQPHSAPLNWLRENGRYMAPRGGGDYLLAAAVIARNWVGMHFVIGVTLLTIFLAANTLRAGMWGLPRWSEWEQLLRTWSFAHLQASPYLAFPALCFALALVPLCWAYWLTQSRQKARSDSVIDRLLAWVNFPLLTSLLLLLLAAVQLGWIGMHAGFADFTHAPATGGGAWAALLLLDVLSIVLWFGHSFAASLTTATPTGAAVISAKLPIDGPAAAQETSAKGNRFHAWENRPHSAEATTRNRLSNWLAVALGCFIASLVFTLVDSLGQTAYDAWDDMHGQTPTLGAAAGALVVIARYLSPLLSKAISSQSKLIRIPSTIIFTLAGCGLALLVMVVWCALAHALLWAGDAPGAAEPAFSPVFWRLTGGVLLCLLTGQTLTFLNLSSIHQFYEAHLRRAYLGAASPRRISALAGAHGLPAARLNRDVTRDTGDDDLPWRAYRPEKSGGPIHFINVTANETVAAKSNLVNRDRKGLCFAVGPCGISVGREDHAVWKDEPANARERRIPGDNQAIVAVSCPVDDVSIFGRPDAGPGFKLELPTLAKWLAISGAAFTTGLGAQTSLGLSLLLSLSNVRLGYWWDSGIDPHKRNYDFSAAERPPLLSVWLEKLFSTQLYLSDEMVARFHGPQRQRWYLSDGGHFENTGAYELIRRRLPFIIISDNGRDENYTFEDLGNLVRKARIDFDAEIRFLSGDELRKRLGDKPDAHSGEPGFRSREAALDEGEKPRPRFDSEATATADDTPDTRACNEPDDDPGGDLSSTGIGTLAKLPRSAAAGLDGASYSRCHATLAEVFYDSAEQPGSLLLIVKPSLIGDEPADVLQYHALHPEFPQESTLDQFFDEAQWESYRKLGYHIGNQLFGAAAAKGTWLPESMRRP